MEIRWFDSLQSTNNFCKLLDPTNVGEFTVVCARSQTGGIGQKGNRWVSEAGKNLTFSVVLKPVFIRAEDQYRLTMALAVAVADSVAALLPQAAVAIKWPNDIYVGPSWGKICGILVTNHTGSGFLSQSICGIGLNVNQTVFPEWVPHPTSLALHSGKEHDFDEVLRLVLANIEECYGKLRSADGTDEIKSRYMQMLFRRGEEAEFVYKGRHLRAVITGVDRFGRLLLDAEEGRLTCDIKEVEFVV